MRARPAASLTGALLFRKGGASPTGFSTRPPYVPPSIAMRGAAQDGKFDGGARKNGARASASGTARLSVRLHPEQHRRLRLVAAHTRQSIQAAIVTALDRYIGEIAPDVVKGGCRCLSQPPGEERQPQEVSIAPSNAAGPRRKEDRS